MVVMNTIDSVAIATPRLLGFAMAGFLALLAHDGFESSLPLPLAIMNMVLHLGPALIVLALVAIAWRWPLAGALGFFAAAAFYASMVPRGHADWILAISGPLAIVGIAFWWSWKRQRLGGTEAA